jgi:aminopeptidase N
LLRKGHQFPEDDGPLAHPVRPDSYIEINNFYTATVYEKGAEVVRMQGCSLMAATRRFAWPARARLSRAPVCSS